MSWYILYVCTYRILKTITRPECMLRDPWGAWMLRSARIHLASFHCTCHLKGLGQLFLACVEMASWFAQEFQLIGDYVAENLVLEHLLLDHCAGYIVTGHCIALFTRRGSMNTQTIMECKLIEGDCASSSAICNVFHSNCEWEQDGG